MNVTRHRIEDLEHDPHWPAKERGDENELRKLAADMNERGQIQPLIAVKNGNKLTVIDGNRRLAAARLDNA
jgi:ParB-like chromosome segregation protein Spo0J